MEALLDLHWTDCTTTPTPINPVSAQLFADRPTNAKQWGEHSFLFFFLHYLGNAATNNFAEVHYDLARVLQERREPGNPKRFLCLFPREHAKTTLVTLGYILWCICYKVKTNIVICSDSKVQAKEFLRNIKTELETNEQILRDFGDMVPGPKRADRKGKWDETHIITANQIQIKLVSPGSQIRGLQFNLRETDEDGNLHTRVQRPDLIILDDVLNDKWIKNKLQRDKLEDWFFGPVFNALDSDIGDVIVIGTIIHHDDLLSRLWKDEDRTRGWVKIRKPACMIQEGVLSAPLWEDRWPIEKLLRRRQEIGSLAFAREFILTPVDESSQFFQADWFRFFIHHDIPREWVPNLMENGYTPLPPDMLLVTAIDPAISKKDKSDYTAVVTLGFSPSRRSYFVLDLYRDRCSPGTQVREMIRQARKWDKTLNDGRGFVHLGFAVETYAYQESLRYWLKKALDNERLMNYRIWERHESVDKPTRVSGMSPMVEQNRLFFPLGLKRDIITGEEFATWTLQDMQEELAEFPNGANDDTVDALQRAYSVLLAEERRYVYAGMYGDEAVDGFESRMKSFPHQQNYFNTLAA